MPDDSERTVQSRFSTARVLPALGCLCVLLLLLAIAFRPAWLATYDLAWPYDDDLFRDTAFAQTIIRGDFPADAYYAGEQNWYNPLGPAVIGGIAHLFGLEPVEIYAHYGAIVGLVVPLAIFGLGVVLWGRWAGLAVLFAFLFLRPNEIPSWAAPTYSPWLFTNLLSLVPFALTIGVAIRARNRDRYGLWAACGLLLGLTFLTHTATAIVAGSVAVVLACDWTRRRAVPIRWGLVLVPAFAVSAPLLATILWHYGLQIKNTAPQDFMWEEAELQRLSQLLWGALNLRNALALGGFVLLFRRRTNRAARLTLITSLGVCSCMLLYGYVRQAWPSAHLPGLVPPFHWLFHLRVAGTLLVGYGLYCAADGLTVLLARWRRLPVPIVLLLILGILLPFQLRPFLHRFDFESARNLSLEYVSLSGFGETIAWLRHQTPPGTVVLAPPHDALIMLGAAGRKTVAIDQTFSNLFVAYEPRIAALEELPRNLANHQRDSFLEIAARHGVSFVLLTDAVPAFSEKCLSAPFVTLVFTSGHFFILRIEY
ncbi:MAG TPA: hypothetical protein VJU77_10925 [Chthoniobacterales bacterium]|nr:hypothetical protein [Chthoniobacterales bacterium]